MERALSFGQVAEEYDRYRPDYPDALYADVVAPRILEAGAGTGRATLALARRGASIVAIEPDPAMAAVVRRRTQGLAVEVRESTFEDCATESGRSIASSPRRPGTGSIPSAAPPSPRAPCVPTARFACGGTARAS